MIRGRVWKAGGLWHHQVCDGGTLLAADNGRDLGPVMQSCREDVAALLVWEAEHMNRPYRIGDRWRCFLVTKRDRGWGGPYGQTPLPVEWTCEDCGHVIRGDGSWTMQRMADHHECGHAPCAYCGQMLLRRKDGTARQHAANRCPAKSDGHKIEREFAKNIERREYV